MSGQGTVRSGWTFRLVEEPKRRRFNRYAALRYGARAYQPKARISR